MTRIPRSWIVITALIAAVIRTSGNEEVKFRWAFGAMTGAGPSRQFVRITDDVTLRSGDEVQMYISPVTACFIYVLHQDSNGVTSLLFPGRADAFPHNYGAAREYYVPDAARWLTLDTATGTERIYLIASRERLTQLETLLQQARAGRAPRGSVSLELQRLAKQRAHTWSERPLTMSGQIRGAPANPNYPDIARHAGEITAAGVFARTFVIEHR